MEPMNDEACVYTYSVDGRTLVAPKELLSSSSTPQEEFAQFEKDCLEEHNSLRALHGCPPLQLSRRLCRIAKEWTTNMVNEGNYGYRRNNNFGENIYKSDDQEVGGRSVVKFWYDQIKFYSFESAKYSTKTAHFTQLIWKSSKKFGVALERGKNTTYVVANYDPSGNISEEFKENVPPLLMS